MKVLFTGGTGLISTAASELAVRSGFDLFLLNRGQRKQLVPEGATILHADIDDTAKVRAMLQDHHFDVVVDWIIFAPKGGERDIELFAGKTDQYIFISTAATYQRPPSHYLITESTPQYNPGWDYARNKKSGPFRKSRRTATAIRRVANDGPSMKGAEIFQSLGRLFRTLVSSGTTGVAK
jgi:nucleoside-diphosphate-sugar epimerase